MHKWIGYVGNKFDTADKIIKHFPNKINTYWEPFCGSLSIYFKLINTKSIQVNSYQLSDSNQDLVNLYNTPKEILLKSYQELRTQLDSSPNPKQFYNLIRSTFNLTKDPTLFHFLIRVCFHKLIRYNNKGEFNAAFNYPPESNVSQITIPDFPKVECQDYYSILDNTTPGDFVYLDPPYMGDGPDYLGQFDFNRLYKFMDKLKNKGVKFGISFNTEIEGLSSHIIKQKVMKFSNKVMTDYFLLG